MDKGYELHKTLLTAVIVHVPKPKDNKVLHNGKEDNEVHKTTAAVAKHGQWHPHYRSKSNGHGDIDRHVDKNKKGDARCQHFNVVVLTPYRQT